MFTGIVTDVGTVAHIGGRNEGLRLRIETSYDPKTIDIGASIACGGVCLTVVALPEEGANDRWFEVEAWEEALRLTTVSGWRPGTRINLERALKVGDELGGHIVSGHVDGMAEIVGRDDEGEAVRFTLEAPRDLARFGEMIRCRGVANGQQVVPGWWLDDIVEADTSPAWAKGDFAELFPGASYRSKWYQIDRGIGILCALGIHGQWIYIHPDAELVAIRLASEPIPLDPEYAKCWRRGFDAIADEFL